MDSNNYVGLSEKMLIINGTHTSMQQNVVCEISSVTPKTFFDFEPDYNLQMLLKAINKGNSSNLKLAYIFINSKHYFDN